MLLSFRSKEIWPLHSASNHTGTQASSGTTCVTNQAIKILLKLKNVFPEDTSRNRTLFHDHDLIKKVDEMNHQPAPPGKDVGRAIQCNARRFVGVNFWVDQSLLSPITNPDGTPKNFPVQCRDKNGQYLYREGKPVMREMTRQQFKSEDDRRRFENLCVEFAQNRMGGQLASLTTHVDERTPHVQGTHRSP